MIKQIYRLKRNFVIYLCYIHIILMMLSNSCFSFEYEKHIIEEKIIKEDTLDREISGDRILRDNENEIIKSIKTTIFSDILTKEIDIRSAALKALEKNISILNKKYSNQISQFVIEEAKALLDPVLKLTISYSNKNSYERILFADKWKDNTTQNTNDTRPVYKNYELPSPIDYLEFDRERVEGFYKTKVTANEKSITDPDNAILFDITLSQQISWGPLIVISAKTMDKESYWLNEDKSHGSYNRPWKSAFIEKFISPLPFCANYGEYSDANVKSLISKLNDEQTKTDVQSVINLTLLEVELSYWELVSQILNFTIVEKHIKTLNQLLKEAESNVKSGDATIYDQKQVELELSKSYEKRETFKSAVIIASNRLKELTDSETEISLLPGNFISLLYANIDLGRSEYSKRDLENNPDLMKQAISIKIAEISFKQALNKIRPNITFSQNFVLSQQNSVFGFNRPDESIFKALTSPDLLQQSYRFDYRYPVLNRFVKSNLEVAKLYRERENIIQEIIKNKIDREISDAQVNLHGAKARIEIGRKNLELAKTSLTEAKEQKQHKEITEYEMVTKNMEVLNSELSFVQARIDYRKAESKLFSALGILLKDYANRSAQSDLDKYRIQSLKNRNILKIF